MSRRSLVLLLLAIAVPATAQTFGLSRGPAAAVCLSIGDARYRLAAAGEHADVTVRIGPEAAPDVRVALAQSIDEADFVFVEGSDAPHCSGKPSGTSVKIDPAASSPDLAVGFASASGPADYRIYVRSRVVTPEAAAALYAAAHMPPRHVARTANAN